MSRRMRIVRNAAIALAALLVVLGIAAISIVQSSWFQDYVKQTIVTSVEDSTGGKVNIGSFGFDWAHLSAVVTDFVIHGTEPTGTPPLVRVARAQLNFRLFTSLHHLWDIAYLGVDRPQANVIVYPDGRTNIPSPRQKLSDKTQLETVVDLAIGRFELTGGLVNFASHKQDLNVRGNNLRALLSYNIISQDYTGQISLQPVYVLSGRNTPVKFTVSVPLSISRNRIDLHNASVASPDSAIRLDASIQDLKNPKLAAHLSGHIALADLKNAVNAPLSLNARNAPPAIDLDANLSNVENTINVKSLHLTLGHSTVEASGHLDRGLSFQSRLALAELGRLNNQTTLPNETATLNATATLDSANKLTLRELRVSAMGGELAGDAYLKNFSEYELHGDLKHFDLAKLIRVMDQAPLPYDGVISGPIRIAGNTETGVRGLTARANLAIAPGLHGVPLSGNLTAEYSGARGDVSIEKSLISLPHSRLSVDGSVGKKLSVALTTANLDDLLAAVPQKSRPAIALRGQAVFNGQVTGSLSAPNISGHFAANRFRVQGRDFDSFQADASITKSGITIQNGDVTRNMMQARFSGTLGLHDWNPIPSSPLAVNASIQNGDLADLLALGNQPSSGYSGQLSANANVNGTFGNPGGSATVVVTNGKAEGQPFDRAEAQVNLAGQSITVPSAFAQLGPARVNLTAEFHHPRDSFTSGQLHASVQSNSIDLSQISALQKQRPNTSGIMAFNGNATGTVSKEFQLTSINGNLSVQGLQSGGQNYGDLTATATTSGEGVSYTLNSNFAGSSIAVVGKTQLIRDYPTTASAKVANLPVERVLAVADRTDIPVRGMVSGTANFSGTTASPQASADLTLSNGKIYDDTVDRLHARASYQPQSIDISQVELVAGRSRLELAAHYDHPAGNLEAGHLQFHLDTGNINLASIKTLTEKRPGIGGTLELKASGAAEIRASEPRFLVQDLTGNLKAAALSMKGKNLGDLTVGANTSGGRTNFTLDSNLTGASIDGRGTVQIANDYPADAEVTFKNVSWTGLRPLLGFEPEEGRGFEASGDGQISLNGPLTDLQRLRGSLQVTRLEVSGASSALRKASPTLITNQGPLAAAFDGGTLTIQSAHLTAPQSDLQATGTVPLNGSDLRIALNGKVDLAILEKFDQAITSSGTVVITAGMRGSVTNPRLTGQVELKNASFDYTGLPTGVWKSNGVIALNGNSAVIRNLTAEAGGGQIALAGSATLSSTLRFGLQARATRVRMLVQQGLGVVASANLSLAGTTESSALTGTVTLDQISYSTQNDLGSILSLAAPPVQTPSTPSPLLENMRLDLRIRSSSALGVQSAMAQNVQLTTDLRVRGTAANPGMLGRVLITEGKLVFFGSTYTVNNGTIAFYNPVRIEPMLDLSLQIQAQGVDVGLRVTGPLDNMKLSYTSDPPLQFQEIVSLLATGTTPTTDPTLLANSPQLSSQSSQQMGESAIVGRALADPVANQLQRVFGVTELKINPAFTSGSHLPEAQLSLKQQISNNVTFTYVTGLNTANAETIQVQWSFTPQWSAQAMRDYNGILSVTLQYKRQFH